MGRFKNTAFAGVKFDLQSLEVFDDGLLHSPQERFVIVEDDEIVHVAEIIPATQPFFDIMIQPVQINVGEKLRGQITDRNAD